MKIFRKIYNHILSSKKSISKEDQWRERGVRIGKNFDAPDSVIDYCFGFLVTIGDNVTLSGISFETIVPAPTITLLPIRTFGKIILPYPTKTLFPITTLPTLLYPRIFFVLPSCANTVVPDNVVVVQGKESTYRILCSYDEYVEKNKQKINNLPVSNILFEQRSSEQQEDWRNLLGSHGGYDL